MLLFLNPLCFLIYDLKFSSLSGILTVGKLFTLLGDVGGGTFVMVGQVDDTGTVVDTLGLIFSVKFSFLLSVVASSGWVLYTLIDSNSSDKLPIEGR